MRRLAECVDRLMDVYEDINQASVEVEWKVDDATAAASLHTWAGNNMHVTLHMAEEQPPAPAPAVTPAMDTDNTAVPTANTATAAPESNVDMLEGLD